MDSALRAILKSSFQPLVSPVLGISAPVQRTITARPIMENRPSRDRPRLGSRRRSLGSRRCRRRSPPATGMARSLSTMAFCRSWGLIMVYIQIVTAMTNVTVIASITRCLRMSPLANTFYRMEQLETDGLNGRGRTADLGSAEAWDGPAGNQPERIPERGLRAG